MDNSTPIFALDSDFAELGGEERAAVLDMQASMNQLRQAIELRDLAAAQRVDQHLADKFSQYTNYSYDDYEIVTCADFAADVVAGLQSPTDETIAQLLTQYDYLFNPASPHYRDSSINDNVVHNTGAYTGPGN